MSDPAAEAERRATQEKMYSLDMDKVMRGAAPGVGMPLIGACLVPPGTRSGHSCRPPAADASSAQASYREHADQSYCRKVPASL